METTKEKPVAIQDLVTIDEYALIIKKTARTVYNLINDGRLTTIELFGKKLINKNDRPRY